MIGTSEFWAAIAGAVVGTAGSGVISWALQRRQFQAAKTEREEERLLRQQGLANAMFFKVLRIASNCEQISKHIETQLNLGDGKPWQFMLPIVNMPDPVHFTSDEMGMLMSLKSDDIFNRAVDIDDAHNSLLAAATEMFRRRQQLVEKLVPTDVNGMVGGSNIAPSKAVIMEMNVVDGLIESVRTAAASEAKTTSALMYELNQLFQEKLDIKVRLERKNTDTRWQTA